LFLLPRLAPALWTTRNDTLALCHVMGVLSHSPKLNPFRSRNVEKQRAPQSRLWEGVLQVFAVFLGKPTP
jgi:hypothetical protein